MACDARTKLIPAFTLGLRTQVLAHQLVHELSKRLALGCPLAFSSDGLVLCSYALTAHSGQWVQGVDQRRRCWAVDARLLYAQLIKHYTCPNCGAGAGRRRRLAEVHQHVYLGTPDAFRQAMCTLG